MALSKFLSDLVCLFVCLLWVDSSGGLYLAGNTPLEKVHRCFPTATGQEGIPRISKNRVQNTLYPPWLQAGDALISIIKI